MTENKRFRISQGNTDRFCHDWQNNQLLNFRETVELLNELNDECEFLEIDNEALEDGVTRYAELCHKSLKENESLKQQIEELEFKLRTNLLEYQGGVNALCSKINGLFDKSKRLEKENEELKEKNKFILGQIKAFRDDCYTYLDFDGESTLNRLLDILGEER